MPEKKEKCPREPDCTFNGFQSATPYARRTWSMAVGWRRLFRGTHWTRSRTIVERSEGDRGFTIDVTAVLHHERNFSRTLRFWTVYELVTTCTRQHQDTGNVVTKRYTTKFINNHRRIQPNQSERFQQVSTKAGQNVVANASTTKESRCCQGGNGAT